MSETRKSRTLTWIAKIWNVISVVFVLAFLFGQGLNTHGVGPTTTEWIGLALWPGGVIVGLIVAWFRKELGGAMAIASLIAFYFWNLLERGKFPGGPYFLLVAAPGILFLLSSLLSRSHRQMRSV